MAPYSGSSTLVLSATGTNQIAAGTGAGLDEFETTARLAAHSNAYRWFGAFVSASLALALVAGMFGLTIDTASDRFLAYFFWVVGYGALLPGWFLARALRSAFSNGSWPPSSSGSSRVMSTWPTRYLL